MCCAVFHGYGNARPIPAKENPSIPKGIEGLVYVFITSVS
jgi:hypothetical protein